MAFLCIHVLAVLRVRIADMAEMHTIVRYGILIVIAMVVARSSDCDGHQIERHHHDGKNARP